MRGRCTSPNAVSRSVDPSTTTARLSTNTTSAPRAIARSHADVDGGGLQLREEDVVSLGRIEILREAGPIGQPCAPSHDVASVDAHQVLDLSAATAPGAVVAKNTLAPARRPAAPG